MFQIKICGITNRDDAIVAAEAGADAIGLNFYPRSRRHISLDTAREIIDALPQTVVKVGLFVNASAAKVCQVYDDLQLDLIQLHGDEPPEYLAQLGGRPGDCPDFRLSENGTVPFRAVRPVMKAFRGDCPNFRSSENGTVPFSTLDVVTAFLAQCAELGTAPGVVMFDSQVAGEYGGTGRTADWDTAREYASQSSLPPLVLAGGLTPDNVAEAIRFVRPAAVDVASGVESSPGRKDPAAVKAFVQAAREGWRQIALRR